MDLRQYVRRASENMTLSMKFNLVSVYLCTICALANVFALTSPRGDWLNFAVVLLCVGAAIANWVLYKMNKHQQYQRLISTLAKPEKSVDFWDF